MAGKAVWFGRPLSAQISEAASRARSSGHLETFVSSARSLPFYGRRGVLRVAAALLKKPEGGAPPAAGSGPGAAGNTAAVAGNAHPPGVAGSTGSSGSGPDEAAATGCGHESSGGATNAAEGASGAAPGSAHAVGVAPGSQAAFDPFADPPEALVVRREWTETHSLLLNKFNVVEGHVLVVTKRFAQQQDRLDRTDAEALWQLVDGASPEGLGGLYFHNFGPLSGASQPHKHGQAVPWPFEPEALPLEEMVAQLRAGAGAGADAAAGVVRRIPDFGFEHGVCLLPHGATPTDMLAAYDLLVAHHGLAQGSHPSRSYNLLCTCRWVLVVPRRNDTFVDAATGLVVSVNSMGFTGSFFVKTADHAAVLERVGAEAVLNHLTFRTSPS